jgi:hypothetical protein
MTSMRKVKKSMRASSNPLYEDWRPFRTFQDLELPELPKAILPIAVELLKIKDDRAIPQLREQLRFVIRDYWLEHRAGVERPPAQWYRKQVKAIRKATDDLLALIRKPTGTGLSQLRFETLRSMGRALRDGPESIERVLEDFRAVCRRCAYSAPKGAIEHTYLRSTVAELAEIWIRYSNRPFARNFTTADNRRYKDGRLDAGAGHADAFVADGPHFVQVMMLYIDPDVPLSLIRTALRSSTVKPRS